MAETIVIGRSKAQGAIYWATPAATANTTNTPIKCAGTTAAQGTADLITQATTNRLTYTGNRTRQFMVTAMVSLTAAGATVAKLHIYKSGAFVTGATQTKTVPISDYVGYAIHALMSLATSEYVELWCETNDEDDTTIQNGILSAVSVD